MALLDALNEKQKKAAETIEGPVMIIAGAGSGKTRTLMYRIAHLLQTGVDPFRIMALTFTNKAAEEMKNRIGELIGPEARSLWMGTFHSVFSRILRAYAGRLGYEQSFTIYDTEDARNLIKSIVKEKNFDIKLYNPKYVSARISMAKSALVGPSDYANNKILTEEDAKMQRPLIGELYTEYQNRLFRAKAMDFDDLLFQTNILLRDNPDVLEKYREHFKYIMVDEYQDTNFAQYLIVRKLAAKHKNICVVGDDSQSIYSFRGANIQNILNFKADYPQAQMIALDQNYRSTSTIVQLSNVLIAKNQGRIPKTIWTENQSGSKVKLIAAPSDDDEGRLVAQEIFETQMNEQAHHKDFAILYRTNNQSKAMEDALRRLNIPYRIYGGKSFYQRKEIKDMVAYFRWVVNPNDEAAFLRCINLPARGIGDTTLDRLRIFASQKSLSLFNAISLLVDPTQVQFSNIQGATATKLLRVHDMIQSLHLRVANTDAYSLALEVWKHSGIEREYKDEGTLEAEVRIKNVEELLNSVQEYLEREHFDVNEETGEMTPLEGLVTLDRFLQEIALLTDMDTKEDEDDQTALNKVTLMTIHAAKGLEYPYVFVVGCEEGLFPSEMSAGSQEELEEERRLFYVAVTRSEKKLWLSFARRRMKWGQRDSASPSRFLMEVEDSGCIDNPSVLKMQIASEWGSDLFFEDENNLRSRWGGRSSGGFNADSRTLPGRQTRTNPPIDTSKLKKVGVRPVGSNSAVGNNSAVGSSTQTTGNPQAAGTSSRPASGPTYVGSTQGGNLKPGARVRHSKFGEGTIQDIQGMGSDERLIVKFDSLPQPKTLLSAFAKLQII